MQVAILETGQVGRRAPVLFTASITDVLLIGRFTECDDPDQVMGLGIHDFSPVWLRSNGSLFSRFDSSMVDDFSRCDPWYLRVGAGVRVWQATDPEPSEWMVTTAPDDREWILDILAIRFGGGPIPFVIEAIQMDWTSG